MSPKLILGWVLGGAVLLGSVHYCAQDRHDHTLKAAQDTLHAAIRDGDRQKSLIDFLSNRAALAEARADSAAARADSLGRAAGRAQVRYVTLHDAAPADCRPALDAADSVIAVLAQDTVDLRKTAQEARSARADTKVALDSVRGSYGRLEAAATTLSRASRPSWVARLTPHLGLGIAAGIDPVTRRPSTAAGITFGWSF